ncbi:MAG: tRNA epoxyqueuosine(34) reductase QueG [Bacteriovorax sp.]
MKNLGKWGIVDFGHTSLEEPLSFSRYTDWVKSKHHLPLTYLEGERLNKRQSLKEHWPSYKSALVFLFSYHQTHQDLAHFYQTDPEWNGLKLASYTLGFEGLDYHHLIRDRLIEIGEELKKEIADLEYKLTLDTHPVLERDLAMKSGLGWFGKNSMLINRHHGSFFIIGSLLLNQDLGLAPKTIEADHCGQCTRCIDACPTSAIDPLTRTIVAKDCISTFTIEQFKLESVPSEKMTLKNGEIFGCDICQDICPWNSRIDRAAPSTESHLVYPDQKKIIDFFLKKEKREIEKELNAMSEGEFKRQFKNTSLERSGRRGLLKNVRLLLKELNILS